MIFFETKIKELSERYLADTRAPDITGLVDHLFQAAAKTGTVACAFNGENRLRFFVGQPQTRTMGFSPKTIQAEETCIVEHKAAQSVMRMMCARLGVICKENTDSDISLYGDKAVIKYDAQQQKRWNISFTNTPDLQEFLIEAA